MFSEKTEIILIIVSKKFYNSRYSTNRMSFRWCSLSSFSLCVCCGNYVTVSVTYIIVSVNISLSYSFTLPLSSMIDCSN